jgi:2-dehydro-3-deoxyphosphogluconate aldolase/(4S)-4-hydroxy-2-oxoglutarate aldolase
MQALDFDLKILKYFPAEALGGIPVLKALSGPFKGVRFIPTGGVTLSSLPGYLDLPAVHACGGSWLAPKKLISSGNFDEITRLASEAVEIVRKTRAKESLS